LAITVIDSGGRLIGSKCNTCRSALAREDVGTFNIVINRHNAFASKPAPTESWSPQVIGMLNPL
jgi:hypothetical protein